MAKKGLTQKGPLLVPALSPLRNVTRLNNPTFRQTRSGREFSPWGVAMGTPYYVPPDFDLEARLQEVREAQAAAGVDGPSEASDNGADGIDPDEPSQFPEHSPVPEPAENLDALYKAVLSSLSNNAGDIDPEAVRFADKPEEVPKSVDHMRRHRKARRQAQRDKRAAETPRSRPFKKTALKHLQNASALQTDANTELKLAQDVGTAPPISTPIETDYSFDMADVPVTANVFTAKPYKQWQYISWTGSKCSTCHALLDQKGFIIGELCGQPKWGNINDPLMKIFETTRDAYSLSAADCENCRGNFPSIATGISFGGGQKHVGNLAHTPHNQAVWNTVMKLVPIKRVANLANYSFRSFFPDVHKFYSTTLDSVCTRDPSLNRNFSNNAFTVMSLNLGPQSISHIHTNHLNLAHGLCAITAIGDYDPVQGGHLVLWDLRMIIEFPPGSTIIIPSAILRHLNTALGSDNECQYALVQYSAGGLFRWAECDYQTQKTFFTAGCEFMQTGKQRWEQGIAMFSRWEDVKKGFKYKA